MASENSDLLVHDVIGRLFEEPEPTHRADLADGAIAHGMAVTRRRGFAVAGATLSVLAVVGGAFAVAGGGSGGGGDWSLGQTARVSPQAFEDPGPTYADREREVFQQLPDVFRPLLPAGVTLSPDQRMGGGVTYMRTGDYLPGLVLRSGGNEYVLHFDTPDSADGSGGYRDAFAKESAAPIAVTGGSIRVAVVPTGPESGTSSMSAWYQFTPTDPARQTIRFYLYSDRDGAPLTTPIDAAAFKKMVESPGFAKLQQLLDPTVPASAAAVRQRYDIEAKINAEAKTVLPPGFRLKLNPGAPGGLELVGPEGVNTFEWFNTTGTQGQISCPAGSLCFAVDANQAYRKMGPDGKERLGAYAGWVGKSTDSSVVLHVFGKSQLGMQNEPVQMGKPVETAPQGPGLTPQQAWAIIQAPGVAKVIADVQKLTAVN